MERYLTYEEYLARGGDLAEADFDAAELRARRRVDGLTYGRVRRMAAAPAEVKAAMMSLITAQAACGPAAQAGAADLASFDADGYSERYFGAGEKAAAVEKALAGELAALLGTALDDEGTPLMYAGGI